MKAKKSLGQNFLKSKPALEKIVAEANVKKGELIVEIGPGLGALTAELLKKGAMVLAIEADLRMVDHLKKIFVAQISSGKLSLIHQDILEFDTQKIYEISESYKIVANIPYYITGLILRKFLEGENKPKSMVLLVQKEVAERIVAKNGKQSILSLSVSAYGNARSAGVVKAKEFSPSPKVDSAILVIENITNDFFSSFDQEIFFKTIKKGFSHKRKVLLNNFDKNEKAKLTDYMNEKNFSPRTRPEELSKEDWKGITSALNS